MECGKRFIVCPHCNTVNPPVAKFCIECGNALQAKAQTELAAPSATTPSPITNQHTEQTPSLPDRLSNPEERRVVTIMFADITGSTPLADRLDPEDMRAILTGYFNLMAEQIRKHGGTLEKYIGDAVMAVFGAPIAHEDDPDRAIRAALDMQTALAQFNQQRQEVDAEATHLQMRIGINTGEVAAPATSNGTQYDRRDFLITGDAVNVAARLQTAATPDTILVGERTYLTTRAVFDFQPLAPLRLKGKAEPIAAWVVLGPHNRNPAITQHPRGIEGLRARLVGREIELDLMHATYARVQAERRPHLITLLGTPGIGKSRLVREFIVREQDKVKSASSHDRLVVPKVLQGRCPPYGEGVTYRPLVEILSSLLQVRNDESPEMVESHLAEFVCEVLDKAQSTEDSLQVARAIIRSVGRRADEISGSQSFIDMDERQRPATITLGKNPPSAPLAKSSPSATIIGKNADQSGGHIAFMRAWRVFLEALARQQPLIIVIDDLQWADEALLDLLEYLTDRLTDVPILFICPARPDFFERRRDWGGGPRNFTTLALEVLSQEESSELIDALLNSEDIPPVLRHTILTRAEGNPFFVEEIVRMLIDQKVLVQENGSWHISTQKETILTDLASPMAPPENTLIDLHYTFPLPRVPDTIQGVLAARVDLLEQTEKRVLQHASIMGRTFWLSALLELASNLSKETVVEALDSLIRHDFIVETEKRVRSPVAYDRVFIFKHVLIRDVVYNNIPRMRRSLEHTQLALWLEEQTKSDVESFTELLAYHYQRAVATWSAGFISNATAAATTPAETPVPVARLTRTELRQRAIKYITLAGDQAFRSYFTIRAIQAYSDALELLADSNANAETLAQMHEKLGHAYSQRGTVDEAWQQYRQALQLIKTEPHVTNVRLLSLYSHLAELGARWLSMFNVNPDMQEVRRYIDGGLALLERETLNGRHAEFLTYQAFWYVDMQLLSTLTQDRAKFAALALQSGNDARQFAEVLDDTHAMWITLDALAVIYRKQQKHREAHQIQHDRLKLEKAIQSREELFDLYYSLGWVHEAVSDYPTAMKWFGYAWKMAQTMESPALLLNCMLGRMHVWHQWNRWDDAQEVAHSILEVIEQFQQNEQWQFEALELLAVLAYRTGQSEEGDRYTRQYKRLLDQCSSPEDTGSVMPFIQLAREDWERAATEFKILLQHNEPFPSPKVLSTLAELLVITGESAEEHCERAVQTAEESGTRSSLAIALRARGRMYLAQELWDAAETDLKLSLLKCKELDLPWERGKTLYCLGLLYRQRANALYKDDPQKRHDDLGRAHCHFEKALGFFEALQAVKDAERAQLALAQESQELV